MHIFIVSFVNTRKYFVIFDFTLVVNCMTFGLKASDT